MNDSHVNALSMVAHMYGNAGLWLEVIMVVAASVCLTLVWRWRDRGRNDRGSLEEIRELIADHAREDMRDALKEVKRSRRWGDRDEARWFAELEDDRR